MDPEVYSPPIHGLAVLVEVIVVAECAFDVEIFCSVLTHNHVVHYFSKFLIECRVWLQNIYEFLPVYLQTLQIFIGNDCVDGHFFEIKLPFSNDCPLTLEFPIAYF